MTDAERSTHVLLMVLRLLRSVAALNEAVEALGLEHLPEAAMVNLQRSRTLMSETIAMAEEYSKT